MGTGEKTDTHDRSGEGTACTTRLSHAAAETCAELLGLFGCEAAVKTVIKDEQEGFRTAQFQIFKKIFRPQAEKFDDFFFTESAGKILKSHLGGKELIFFMGKIVVLEQIYKVAAHGLEYFRLAVVILLCLGLVFLFEDHDQ